MFELVANLTNASAVFLAARNSIWNWPIGIIGCLLFGIMFLQANLYADVTLQIFFIVTSLYGWYIWNPKQIAEKITTISTKDLALYIVFGLIGAVAYGTLLFYTTNAYAPFIDSIVLTFSIIGQLLLMKRKFECWYFWIIVDIIAIPLYFSRELYITSFFYGLFLINALYGYYQWRKEIA